LGRISRKPARQHVKSTQIEKVTGARQPHRRLSRKKAQGATTCMYLHISGLKPAVLLQICAQFCVQLAGSPKWQVGS
jgi:hypothetical protein